MAAFCRSGLQLLLLIALGTAISITAAGATGSDENRGPQPTGAGSSPGSSSSALSDDASPNGAAGQSRPVSSAGTVLSPVPDADSLPEAALGVDAGPPSDISAGPENMVATRGFSSSAAESKGPETSESNTQGSEGNHNLRGLLRRRRKPRPEYIIPGQYAGALAGSPSCESRNVVLVGTKSLNFSAGATSPASASASESTATSKNKTVSSCFSKFASSRPSWDLHGDLSQPPPSSPPTLREFAEVLARGTAALFARSAAAAARSRARTPGQSPSLPSAVQRRARFRFLSKLNRSHASSDGEDGKNDAKRNGSDGDQSSGSNSASECDTGVSRGSSGELPGRVPTGAQGGRGSEADNGPGVTCLASRYSLECSGTGTAGVAAVSRTSTAVQPSAAWLPGLRAEELEMAGNIVTNFVLERRRPKTPTAPLVPEAVAGRVMQMMADTPPLSNFLSGPELDFTFHTCRDGRHSQTLKTAFVFEIPGNLEQSLYMSQTLTRLRHMFWALQHLRGGTVPPWEAAAKYGLSVPLDVSTAADAGVLVNVGADHVAVNCFLTREIQLCTLEEFLKMRPSAPEGERGPWQFITLSFSVQLINILSNLSAEGLPVHSIDEHSISVTSRGALVVTDIVPSDVIPRRDGHALARLLFLLWCGPQYEEYVAASRSLDTSLESICSELAPYIVLFSIKALGAQHGMRRMNLKGLRESRMYQDLTASLPVVLRRLRQQGQLKEASSAKQSE